MENIFCDIFTFPDERDIEKLFVLDVALCEKGG